MNVALFAADTGVAITIMYWLGIILSGMFVGGVIWITTSIVKKMRK